MTAAVELFVGPECFHAEGPVWIPAAGGLCWVDMMVGDILRRNDFGVDRWHVGTVAAMLRPRSGGGLVIALEHDVVAAGAFGGALTSVARVLTDPEIRLNEGGSDPDGNLLIGSMAYDEGPGRGGLYRVSPVGEVETVVDAVTISNGLAWTADGSTAYYADTPTGRIDIFDWTTELGLHSRRALVGIDPSVGYPDGLTVDADGGIWVALWSGHAVHRYLPDGTLDRVVELPVSQVTACTFGGPDLDQLYVTTSAKEVDRAAEPLAGSVFVADVGVRGLPARPFAG